MSMSGYDNLEFKHFKSIIAIGEEGTITAAANRLRMAQSAAAKRANRTRM
jgi:DNA-binding transcriptional LysR family regulator